MPVNTRPRVVSFALKTLTSAVACAVLLSPAVQAAGLGKLSVLSSLGQPLQAEIELTAVSSEEAGALVAKLAPVDAFRLANIEFNPTLLSLRFAVEQRGARQFIRISSAQPVNEPFVDMLLELSWNSGRLVREYTFLLDPADLRQPQSAQVAAPVDLQNAPQRPALTPQPQSQPAAAPAPGAAERAAAERATRAPRPAPAAAAVAERTPPAPKAQPAQQAEHDAYRVKKGDTLGRIAAQLKPVDISLDMMLVALYRANPEAFAGKNMNRLRSGQILALPDADTIRATGEAEARGVVVAHAADFAAYRNKLAGQVAVSTPAKAAEAGQSAAGKISAKVEEHATPANEAKDQLKLSKAAPAVAAAGKTAVAGAEDKLAKEQQVAEAAARVKELEKNVSDLEKLMAVKNKAMAEQQKKPEPLAAAAPAAASASASAAAAASRPAEPAAEQAAPKPKPKPKPLLLVKKAPPPEPSLLDMVFENISAIGVALAALLGGGALIASRRKKKAQPKFEPSVLGEPGAQAQTLFAETGGQSVDTNNSVFNSNFAPSASQLDTNEVDPVAEADVYIAYGRDAQAEEILKEALRTHPERHPVRLKLLEIYAARKDARAFETQAGELYSQTKGQGEEWLQAAALGISVDPLNPLYAGSDGAPAAAPRAAVAEETFDASAPDFGLSAEAAAPAVAQPEAEQKTALPTPAAAEADNFLDFDLGGLSFEPVTSASAAAMAAPAEEATAVPVPEPLAQPAAEAMPEMDFDMAFDLPIMAEAPAAPAAPARPEAVADLDFGADFGLGLDLPAASEPVAASDKVAPAPLPDPLMDLDLMNFDLPAATPAAEVAGAETALDEFFGKRELPVDPPASAAPTAPEFDLSGIDLDLGLGSGDAPGAAAADEAQSANHLEMDTKLDLAVAYQEIGDKEGARELIDEVIKGGSPSQVAKANSMRALLG